MKIKLMKNKKTFAAKIFHERYLYPKTTADFTSRVSKSYVPFTCKCIPYGYAFCANFSQALQVKTQFLRF